MGTPFPKWIEKRMIRGAKGFNLDTYVMALEGWRRGLTLTWYYDPSEVTDLKIIGFNPLGKSFSLKDNEIGKVHHFYRSRGDLVANEAVDTVHNKYETKTYLQQKDISVPEGILFNKTHDISAIIKDSKQLNYPLVIKPVFGSLGKGVITNIKTEEHLRDAINQTMENEEYDEFIIEEHVSGTDYRIYVVGEEVIAATRRIPANVIGDGKKTIEQLIEDKNNERQENPYLQRKKIEVDNTLIQFIGEQQLTIDSILEKEKQIFLKGQSNIAAGGDPVDVTDELDEDVKALAIRAVQAIPGLTHAGVDVISTDEQATVIEINATADISMHLFPLQGNPRNVPEKIIDYYFPETIGRSKNCIRLYFDYREIRKVLRDKLAQEISLIDAPKGQLYTTRYIVSGKVQQVGYRAWIRRQAVKKGLHGYTRNLSDGRVVVVIAGDSKRELERFKNICKTGPPRAEVKDIKELDWTKPIKLGFEIRKTR